MLFVVKIALRRKSMKLSAVQQQFKQSKYMVALEIKLPVAFLERV